MYHLSRIFPLLEHSLVLRLQDESGNNLLAEVKSCSLCRNSKFYTYEEVEKHLASAWHKKNEDAYFEANPGARERMEAEQNDESDGEADSESSESEEEDEDAPSAKAAQKAKAAPKQQQQKQQAVAKSSGKAAAPKGGNDSDDGSSGDESDDEKVTNGYQAAFAWQHYHFSIKPVRV